MTPITIEKYDSTIFPALQILPEKMRAAKAVIQIAATAMQESNFIHLVQIGGPAVSWWQFEPIAILDVLQRTTSARYAREACNHYGVTLSGDLNKDTRKLYDLFKLQEYQQLACVFTRLNYWNSPISIPEIGNVNPAYLFYKRVWRPGRPRPERWPKAYSLATQITKEL